jgi:hypothetical protein
MLTNDWIVANI